MIDSNRFRALGCALLVGALSATVCSAQSCLVPSSTYPTIQSAVDDIACAVVDVQAGTYVENITVTRATPLRLSGAGLGQTQIDGSAAAQATLSAQMTGVGSSLIVTDLPIGNGVGTTRAGGVDVIGEDSAGPLVLRRVRLTRNEGPAALQARRMGVALIEDSLFDRNVGSVISTSFGGDGTDYIIRRSTFEENTAPPGEGGITLQIGADLELTDSQLINNAHCGGVGATTGTFERLLVQGNAGTDCLVQCAAQLDVGVIRNATIADNLAAGLCTVGPRLIVENTTISGNRSNGVVQAGGFDQSFPVGPFTIFRNVTLVNNTAASGVGGIRVHMGSLVLAGSIVAGNAGVQCLDFPDGPGVITSFDYNLDSDGTCFLTAPNDLPSIVDPRIGALQDNGGGLPTHALLEDSPAVDAAASDVGLTCASTDQRGTARPQGLACDIGAFELEQPQR
ncbi:MAG: right-handed parallel beta-helix repeat-containing protein [Pseudomonadota bacterium]